MKKRYMVLENHLFKTFFYKNSTLHVFKFLENIFQLVHSKLTQRRKLCEGYLKKLSLGRNFSPVSSRFSFWTFTFKHWRCFSIFSPFSAWNFGFLWDFFLDFCLDFFFVFLFWFLFGFLFGLLFGFLFVFEISVISFLSLGFEIALCEAVWIFLRLPRQRKTLFRRSVDLSYSTALMLIHNVECF